MYITQSLKRALQVRRNEIATIDGERQRTWSEFAERVAKLAGALQNLGIEDGDRIAILALNSDRYLEFFYASVWLGAILVPLNIRLAIPELVYMLNDAEAKLLAVDDNFIEKTSSILENAKTIQHIILASDSKPIGDSLSYEAVLEAATSIPDADKGNDDIAGIFYTGGTTGLPKGVMLSHTNLVSNAMTALLNIYEGQPWIYLHSAPMFHIADAQWMVGVTMQGGTHVFMPRFVPEELFKAVAQYKVTHCALVPTMVNMLLNEPSIENYDLSTLRGMNYGGSPMPPALIARTRKAFPDCRLFQGYGQTETAPNVSMLLDEYHNPDGQYADKIESAGQAMFTVEIKIVDFNDKELPLGEVGEIAVRGPNIMQGYWNKPQETAHALRGGWMHTGDAGFLDEDGFLFIVDRVKDMIISGGENIYSAEVEAAIYQYPAVAACAVIGVPSEKWGESVHAIVVPRQGEILNEDDIMQHCRELIAGYKCPRSVEIRKDPLPMSGAGKILKRELRQPFWEGKTRSIN
jgi:long-chain acyl-CoA synthetase